MAFRNTILYNDIEILCGSGLIADSLSGTNTSFGLCGLRASWAQIGNRRERRERFVKRLHKKHLHLRLCLWVMPLLLIVGLIFVSRGSTASITIPNLTDFHVLIGDSYYGVFDHIEVIAVNERYQRVRLERDFVSHSSLSFWAQERRLQLREPQDIKLIATRGGYQMHYTLERSLPLAWSLNAGDANSGYHEIIELAVQRISSLP